MMTDLKSDSDHGAEFESAAPTWEAGDVVVISALEHWSYCPRQCALIHLDQSFDENIYTLRGRLLHEGAEERETTFEDHMRTERGLMLWSNRLGLVGKADVVEFHGETPYPVEYKLGPRRKYVHPELQVCAQALCLEEMTGKPVPRGAIYHHGSRRRREVVFDDSLRRLVEAAVAAVRELLAQPQLPPPLNDARCRNCSLLESCLPSVVSNRAKVRFVIASLFRVTQGE